MEESLPVDFQMEDNLPVDFRTVDSHSADSLAGGDSQVEEDNLLVADNLPADSQVEEDNLLVADSRVEEDSLPVDIQQIPAHKLAFAVQQRCR